MCTRHVLLLCVVLGGFVISTDGKKRGPPKRAFQEKVIYDVGSNAARATVTRDKKRTLYIEIASNNSNATVHVNGRLVWWHSVLARDVPPNPVDPDNILGRGLYLLSLHPVTGRVQGQAVASGWMQVDAGHAVREAVRDARRQDILLLFSIGEIGPGMMNSGDMLRFMAALGARHFAGRGESDMYALVTVKDGATVALASGATADELVVGGTAVAEAYVANAAPKYHVFNQHEKPLHVGVTLTALKVQDILCSWKKTPKTVARAKFCFQYDGYGDLCDCDKRDFLPLPHNELKGSNLTDVPIAVVASNRPKALFRSMRSLLQNRGVVRSNIIVFVDGEHKEVDELCELLDIKCRSQTNDFEDVTYRTREHYRQLLHAVWVHFPHANRLIVLEEDLEVSPDFVSYFSQTSHLLDVDPSLWCISAWNDNAFQITSADPTLLYRVEYMPGLGWMMKKSVVQELLKKWPPITQAYDWDVWVRWDSNRLDRECVVPDVSRTFHFGITGQHSSSAFHALYYNDHAFNTEPDVQLRNVDGLTEERYEDEVRRLLESARPLGPADFNLSGDSGASAECDPRLEGTGNTYAAFFTMKNWDDTEMYKTIAKCMKIWDLDVRGHHKGLWRFIYEDNHILMFGVPITKYMNDVVKLFKHPVEILNELRVT